MANVILLSIIYLSHFDVIFCVILPIAVWLIATLQIVLQLSITPLCVVILLFYHVSFSLKSRRLLFLG
jgi:hypothetical protein